MSTTKRRMKRIRERALLMKQANLPKAEVCVSFSRKFNLANYGGPQYEAIDLFVSRKVQCDPQALEALTREMQQECADQVEWFAREYLLEMKRKLKEGRR